MTEREALRRFRRVASDWNEKVAHGPAHAGSAGAAWPMRGFSMLRRHLEASAQQTALVKSAANTNTARANAEWVQATQEAKFCNSCNHPIYSCAWRVPSHARPGNLVRSGTKQPYWCACSAEDKARHFRTCRRRSEDPGPDSISAHWGILHSR